MEQRIPSWMEKDWEARFNPPERHPIWSELWPELLSGLFEGLPIFVVLPVLMLVGVLASFQAKERVPVKLL